ncbi:putative bifunctional diguanylate cyclase/phosphodiesterase [Methylobacterium planeticum]|uniref:EAL domain-containing protein n=1 Tax=Methylobacterium planeticum TaxID=2615211 RepID=A0A6N6MTG0_9HYPH|nr:EAL domain-containing protein [Methylobacterium planeticum]KAB1074259.1 EAL domain-containing protein [Methylobacterium planeticum]
MAEKRGGSWGEGELYDALCLLMIGVCCWIIGAQFHVFAALHGFILAHDLSNQLMLGLVMGFAMMVVSLRKSLKLRQAMLERDATTARAESIARHDALTGLANRRLFLEAVEARRRATGAEPSSAVLLVDLDRFKPVNDLYGHAAGNAVLCAVAERLAGLLPARGVAARIGGDEFALVVPLEGGSEALARLAQAMIGSIAAPILWNDNALKVGATIGIALITHDDADAEVALHAADLAMYQGKKDGRGNYRVFKSAMDVELKARAQLESELRAAIMNGEIEPFYQPVVSLPERTLIGVEVLARWRHPTRGLLAPARFITIAEETGLIADLSYRLLRQACRDARDWPVHLQIALNISPQQFQDAGLSERILAILNETGLAPNRLEVEITETALVQDLEAARTTLTSLQNLGVRIALDDFGTGYSSLYHLRELKFDKLKIDRSYVDTITMSDERAKLVDAIIKLSASLGLVTTAEGIETDASLDWLSTQGCDFGQGYLFGAPMPKSEIDTLVSIDPAVIKARLAA